jgi:hypothetical protein
MNRNNKLNLMELGLVILILFSSCKKKKEDAPSPPNNPNLPSNTSLQQGPPPNPNQINGFFLVNHFKHLDFGLNYYNTDVGMSNSYNSLFTFNPFLNIVTGFDYADTIKRNNVALKFNTNAKKYTDTTMSVYSDPSAFQVKGNSLFSAFSVTIQHLPVISNTAFIPSQISKSQNLVLSWGNGNISNVDSICIMISDNSSGQFRYKSLPASLSSCTINASEISFLNVNSLNTQLQLFVKKYSYIIVNNKVFVFCTARQLVKNLNVTN